MEPIKNESKKAVRNTQETKVILGFFLLFFVVVPVVFVVGACVVFVV